MKNFINNNPGIAALIISMLIIFATLFMQVVNSNVLESHKDEIVRLQEQVAMLQEDAVVFYDKTGQLAGNQQGIIQYITKEVVTYDELDDYLKELFGDKF